MDAAGEHGHRSAAARLRSGGRQALRLRRGGSAEERLSTAEVYDPASDSWAQVTSLTSARCILWRSLSELYVFSEYSALIPLLQRQVLCVDTTASTPSTLR